MDVSLSDKENKINDIDKQSGDEEDKGFSKRGSVTEEVLGFCSFEYII